MRKICKRLGVALSDENIGIDETPINLADPVSVNSFLTLNPGRFTLIVIDPYYMAIPGGASREDLAKPVMKSIKNRRRNRGRRLARASPPARQRRHRRASVWHGLCRGRIVGDDAHHPQCSRYGNGYSAVS